MSRRVVSCRFTSRRFQFRLFDIVGFVTSFVLHCAKVILGLIYFALVASIQFELTLFSLISFFACFISFFIYLYLLIVANMGEVLSKPVTETHSSKGCSKNLIYGQSCMQGYRKCKSVIQSGRAAENMSMSMISLSISFLLLHE